MQFDLVTPEKLLVSESATHVSIPGSEGSFGVLSGHQPTISTLNPGKVVVENGDSSKEFFVSYGFADVTGEKVTILVEEASLKEEIDTEVVTEMLNNATNQYSQLIKSSADTSDIESAEKKILNLEAKLKVAQGQ